MKLFYHHVTTNFGDYLNSWLWPALIPELLDRKDDNVLVGIGSLLSHGLNVVPGNKVVFGTGSGYGNLPSKADVAAWDFFAVRGPLTARFLGLDPKLAITDGAWLIDNIPRWAEFSPERKGTVFIPHWESAFYGNWEGACARSDVTFVDPLDTCETVFSALAGADLAIVESLHGAIIADYFRTPWIPVASPSRVLKFKWLDWCMSLDLPYEPFALPASDYLDAVFQKRPTGFGDRPLERIQVPNDTFDVRTSPPPRSNPGALARAKKKVKLTLRDARTSLVGGVNVARRTGLMNSLNAKRADSVAHYFNKVKAERPYLSAEAKRAERLEQLSAALHSLKVKYGG